MTPTVAVIAPGNMGSAVAARLTENGVTVVTSLAGRSAASAQRAAVAGMTDAGDADIAATDFVLSIVPPGEALALAERLKPALRAAVRKPVFVDCNAISPQTAGAVAASIGEAGCPFVDGGIIGPPPAGADTRTVIYVSGDAAGRVEALNRHGLRIRHAGTRIGDASALKMSYAGITKGLVALGAAMALAAERAGIGDALRTELSESQPAVLGQLSRGVPGMFPKAYRWVAEFEEIARFAGSAADAEIFEDIARLYSRIARDVEGPNAETTALARFYGRAPGRSK
jgi:3-hydroxyisobutyrate dehydrogenase-like beta-hydroxyacid dehydrogenase